jgi:hypothetical protein
MPEEHLRRGALVPEKSGEGTEGHPEPEAAEVESARLLANSARERLHAHGFDDDDIRRSADEYVALDLGEETGDFASWVSSAVLARSQLDR